MGQNMQHERDKLLLGMWVMGMAMLVMLQEIRPYPAWRCLSYSVGDPIITRSRLCMSQEHVFGHASYGYVDCYLLIVEVLSLLWCQHAVPSAW